MLFTRATLEHVAHLREPAACSRGCAPGIGVVVVADPRDYRASIAEVGRIISSEAARKSPQLPTTVLGGFAPTRRARKCCAADGAGAWTDRC